jgi:DNA-binding transcriptional regulator GbsR (MarR family)
VFKRLRVDQVDNDFVARCAASFKAVKSGDIDTLVVLVEKASKKTPDDLEKEESEDKASDTKKEEKSGNHGSAEEKKMYDPLVCNTLRGFSLLL